jgi:ubiquinone/menaquinone biosynthesis C-methylase UbiE
MRCNGKMVLDLGCGTGYGTDLISRMGAKLAIGGDIHEGSLASAGARYGRASKAWVKLDASRLPFRSGVFDVIACFEVIEHVLSPLQLLTECKRVLKDDGFLVLSTPNAVAHFQFLRSPYHVDEFEPDRLRRLVLEVFPSMELYGQRYMREKLVPLARWYTLAAEAAGLVLANISRKLRDGLVLLLMKDNRRVSLEEVMALYHSEETALANYAVDSASSRTDLAPRVLVCVAYARNTLR